MAENKTIEVPDFITVRDLAALMEVSPIDVIKELMTNGVMVNINQQIDFDTAAIVAEEMGYEPHSPDEIEGDDEGEALSTWQELIAQEAEKDLKSRPPVVTILGHVDHGKTSLLDLIRNANVVEGEAGGITQHIGAYQAEHDGQTITFLDTPGHEAFTAMRARGAQTTDIAVLVVAADDGIMPQTTEAISHARAANVPIVVAINKIDLPTARPDFVKQQLSDVGLTPDDWQGDTLMVAVSAKEKLGIDDLLEAILLTAESLNPQANPQGTTTGSVLEARTERGRGVMATLLVQNGTLKVGDTLLINDHYGRIKAMYDYKGKRIKKAGPSAPVSVSGLNGMPEAGEQFEIVKSEKEARRILAEQEREQELAVAQRRTSLEDFFSQMQVDGQKQLLLIVKVDVQGSLDPLVSSLEKIENEEVELEILHAGIGQISESDVMLASASDAVILGFSVDVGPAARKAATSEGVEIRTYDVIYHLLEDVEKAMLGLMEPTYKQVIIGRAEVRQVFRIKRVGNIAGSYMRTGEARRNAMARVIRDRKVVHEDRVSSLKHLQDDVREVKQGFEFGVNVARFEDYKEGDIIEFFVTEQVQPGQA
ncbi:MAG: translation initiation factor IF-2 [Ardenticatenaceae bacterium]|nr:translation initiation factor IF-2 [Ardenticatenaceae bacterium]